MTGGVKKNQNGHFFVENAKNKNIQLCVLHQLTAVCFYFFNFQQKKAHFDFFTPTIFANISRIYSFLNRVDLIINKLQIEC